MIATSASRADVVALSETAAFNRWAGFEVVDASDGRAELKLPWRTDLGQYAGFLHASMIGGMIDTACGFAAFTLSGRVLASHISVNCLAPATGDAFVARARVVKAGRRQVFAHAELFALRGDGRAPRRHRRRHPRAARCRRRCRRRQRRQRAKPPGRICSMKRLR